MVFNKETYPYLKEDISKQSKKQCKDPEGQNTDAKGTQEAMCIKCQVRGKGSREETGSYLPFAVVGQISTSVLILGAILGFCTRVV